MSEPTDDFKFGATSRLGACCGKPVGCNMDAPGCLFPRQKAEWKAKVRAQAATDTPSDESGDDDDV